MTDLLELAECVEAGKTDKDFRHELQAALGWTVVHAVNKALVESSLDAAKALHDAVLPGWEWGVDWLDNDQLAYVRKGMVLHESYAKEPAAAWVAAILRAKA